MTSEKQDPTPERPQEGTEFSRPIDVRELPGPRTFEIKADDLERTALARRFGLEGEGLLAFSAELTIKPAKKGQEAHLTGTITADLRQNCVVTLESFDSQLVAWLDIFYSAEAKDDPLAEPPEPIDAESGGMLGEAPEPMIDGIVDIGEAAAQTLGLEINPFPRIPGVLLEEEPVSRPKKSAGEAQAVDAPLAGSPFAKLADLKLPKDR